MRADARQNRERVVDAARTLLADGGDAASPPSHEAVAAQAGVGVGTVYRHFPTRSELVEAVYGSELDAVCAAAADLLERHPPLVALREWMARYAGFVAAKRGMGQALRDLVSSGAVTSATTRPRLQAAVEPILAAAYADGSLRDGVRADDVVAAMAGSLMAAAGSDAAARAAQVERLLDLLVAGLRA